MCRLIATIWLFLFSLSGINAQEQQLDFNTINMETYRLYVGQNWDSLIAMGKEAIKNDIDYYYLRMRLGIAYYSKKNYKKSAGHFTQALLFNQDDPVALEYLYFALLFSGQEDQAHLVRKQFKGDLALRLPPPNGKFIDRIGIEYLYFRGMNEDVLSDPDALILGLNAGIQNLSRYYSNASLSLVNRLTPGFTLTHAYNFLAKTNLYSYSDGLSGFILENQHVYQHQYYISPTITTLSGFEITPMFHVVHIRYQTTSDLGQGFQGGNSAGVLSYLDETDYITGVGVSKGTGTIDVQLGAYYSTLNQAKQIQNRLGIIWYPFGSLNLYAGGSLNSQYESSSGVGVIRIIPELQIGFTIAEKVWFDVNGAMGEMSNYLEQNGSIVHNNFTEAIHKKVTLTVSLPVTKKGSLLYLGGRWTSNQSEFYSFDPELSDFTNSISYNTFSIYGGISWKF